MAVELNSEERAWLSGQSGKATQRAMEIIVALGNIYGADHLIPVESVQISGVSYRNLGEAGLDFLRQWADEGARVRVPTTLNPTAMDMQDWEIQGFSPAFAQKQQQVIKSFVDMGVGETQRDGKGPTPTCTPYLVGNRPRPGTHISWAESSAVSFANSALGARTNREGGPGAIAAAITGRTAAYGLHLDTNRQATLRVQVNVQPHTISDYSALGALIGQAARKAVPYFVGLPLTRGTPLWQDKLKALGAAMAATGAVALYHVAGITPEAQADDILAASHQSITISDLRNGYALLSDDIEEIDLVWIGCPHASIAEITHIASALQNKHLRIPLWITCARPIKEKALEQGLFATIEAAGGQLFADACMAIAPMRELGFRAVATPSAKGAYYLRNLANVAARFVTLDQCILAASTGQWQ